MPFEVTCDQHPDYKSDIPVDAFRHIWREHPGIAAADLRGVVHVRFKLQVEAQTEERTIITHCRRCAARIIRRVAAGTIEEYNIPVCDNCITQELP